MRNVDGGKQVSNIKNWLPGTHKWVCNFAKKEKKRDRAREGFLIRNKMEGGGNNNSELGTKLKESSLISKIKNRKQK